jgi:hypothetical protein
VAVVAAENAGKLPAGNFSAPALIRKAEYEIYKKPAAAHSRFSGLCYSRIAGLMATPVAALAEPRTAS